MNKMLSIAIGIAISTAPMIALAQSYESYRQAADGYRPTQQPAPYDAYRSVQQPQQAQPRWDSVNTQVLPPVRNFDRASAATSSDNFGDSGYPSTQPAPSEYQPAPQRCGTGQMFIVAPDNSTTRGQITMCQNEVGLWVVKR